MIRPTGRMVLIFVGGIPLALFVVIYDPALWPLSFNYGILVVLAAASDVMLALWDAFKREDIHVPYPVRVIRVRDGALPVQSAADATT